MTITPEQIVAGREGPSIIIQIKCFGCRFETSKRYRVQGDSGIDVYCQHPSFPERKAVGDTRWDTPDWCPVIDVPATRAILQEQTP